LAVIFAFYFHLANGIRHLAWDAGWGYEMPTLRASGVVVLVFSTSVTILTFLAGYWAAGVI
jgi:succinate dehydrogenase / fumarate reductase cytochrome b subunit